MQAQAAPDATGQFQGRRVTSADFHDAAFDRFGGGCRQRHHGA
jgi:hypothetical protein